MRNVSESHELLDLDTNSDINTQTHTHAEAHYDGRLLIKIILRYIFMRQKKCINVLCNVEINKNSIIILPIICLMSVILTWNKSFWDDEFPVFTVILIVFRILHI